MVTALHSIQNIHTNQSTYEAELTEDLVVDGETYGYVVILHSIHILIVLIYIMCIKYFT